MKIELSDHAKQHLKRRNIVHELVIATVESPEEVIDSFRNRTLLRRKIDGNILEEVTKKEGSKIIVITAYYLEY